MRVFNDRNQPATELYYTFFRCLGDWLYAFSRLCFSSIWDVVNGGSF